MKHLSDIDTMTDDQTLVKLKDVFTNNAPDDQNKWKIIQKSFKKEK